VTFPSAGSPEFWEAYYRLPEAVRALARKNYRLWQGDPFHPSLNFKKVSGENWSVRIGAHYRATGKFVEHAFLWEWIGTHEEYNRLI
jgi:hypothetical protein